MISNPCRWFVNGSETESFVYEGGSRLFHFSSHDCGLSDTFDLNVTFFANDHKHAIDVLKRMLEFRIECSNKYLAKRKHSGAYSDKELIERAETNKKDALYYLWKLNEGRVKVSLAPTNQFYTAGWAWNDVILNH